MRADIAASFQRVAVQHLAMKCQRAVTWARETCPHLTCAPPRIPGGPCSRTVIAASHGSLCHVEAGTSRDTAGEEFPAPNEHGGGRVRSTQQPADPHCWVAVSMPRGHVHCAPMFTVNPCALRSHGMRPWGAGCFGIMSY